MQFLQGYHDIKRTEQILRVLSKHEINFLLKTIKHEKGIKPRALRALLEDLGGTFVKLGQMLSLREDLIPKQYCKELRKLQDQGQRIPDHKVQQILQTSYRRSPFITFKKTPLASASFGQVHEARLHDGTKVAVKIRRAGIVEQVQADIDLLQYFIHYYKKKIRVVNLQDVLDEFKKYTNEEIDYTHEGKNLQDFQALGLPVISPTYYKEYSTPNVLVMSYIEGKRITKLKTKKEKTKALDHIVQSFLRQVFDKGIFHADPHPGNIFVHKGKIALLDFGQLGRLTKQDKEKVRSTFMHLLPLDAVSLVNDLEHLGLASKRINKKLLAKDLQSLIEPYLKQDLSHIHISTLLQSVLEVARIHGLRLHKNYVLLLKAFITLEGVGQELDPQYKIVEATMPYARKMLLEQSPLYASTRVFKQFKKTATFLLEQPEKQARMLEAIEQQESTTNALAKEVYSLRKGMKIITKEILLVNILAIMIVINLLLAKTPPLWLGLSIFTWFGVGLSLILALQLFGMLRKT